MATLKDLIASGMSRDEINALLSQGTVGTEGFQQSGFMGGEPYMPPPQAEPQQPPRFAVGEDGLSRMTDRPGEVEQAPMNTIRNNSTGVVTQMPSSGQRSHDVWADGPQEIGRYQLANGRTEIIRKIPVMRDGRQSVGMERLIETPDYLNPAMVAKQKYEGQAANIAHTQMQTDPAKAAEYARQVAEGKQKGEMTGFGNTAQQNSTGTNALSGLPPAMADQVKALAEGRMAFPSGFALKSPYWQQMLQMVSQYDPNFDAINYNARSKTRQDFTSGKSAENIKSLNTAIGHLDTITQKFDALENSSFPSYNTSANWTGSKLGNEKIQSAVGGFDTAKLAVSGEMAKVFRSVGMSQQEIEHWMDRLSSSQSPADFKSTIKTATDLMGGRLDAIGDQYTKGMGKSTQGLDLLSPDAKKQFQKIQGGGNTSGGTSTSVTLPNGQVKVFPSGAAAEAFRMETGLR